MFKELSESSRVSVPVFCSHTLMVFLGYIPARNTLPSKLCSVVVRSRALSGVNDGLTDG